MATKTSVCKLANCEGFEITVNVNYDENNEFDEGEMSFNHVMTNSECQTVSQVLQGWSEHDSEDNRRWKKLVEAIEKDDMLSQKIFDDIEVIEYELELKTYQEFRVELTTESEEIIERVLENYTGSEGVYKRAYELYKEGFELSNKDAEAIEYYSNVNQYVEDYFEQIEENCI